MKIQCWRRLLLHSLKTQNLRMEWADTKGSSLKGNIGQGIVQN
uniref:Uncharacterized protein n=1 Tax=Vitis vinifera TaxID=29760 RepID=F6HBD4_VITVI